MIILFEENGKLYRFDGHEEHPPFPSFDEPGVCFLERLSVGLEPLDKYEEVHTHDCLRAIAEIRNEILESSPFIDFYEFFELVKSMRKAQKQSKSGLSKAAYEMIVLERELKVDDLLSRIDKLTGVEACQDD